MAKLQVRLLVLIALGTISRGQGIGGPQPNNGAVIPSMPAIPSWDCDLPVPEDLGFDGTEVAIPGSGLVYHRVTVTDFQLQLAINTSVSLPSDCFLQCAIATAIAGLGAFTFEESCTGYRLNLHFLKHQAGDVAFHVRADYLDEEPTVVPMAEAPYKFVDDGMVDPYRVYMLSAYVDVGNHPSFRKTDKFEEVFSSNPKNNFVFLENGDVIFSNYLLLDVNSCLNNAAFGLQVVVSPELYKATIPTVYFFEECGQRIKVPNSSSAIKMLMFSHRGFGCKPYPSGLRDQCSVVFESEVSLPLSAQFGFFFSNDNSDAGGLIMKVTGRKENSVMTTDMYRPRATRRFGNQLRFIVSMQRQPSKPAVGFFMAFS